METSFKTCMFGGFDREDVISFIQKTAEENQTRLDALTAENEKLLAEQQATEQQNRELSDRLAELEQRIRRIKHAINLFNATHTVPGFDMTIDEMLVYIPQLTQRKNKLADMKARLPKERVEEQYGRQSNIIDYTYANYDLAAVEADYERVSDELSRAQLALDAVNQRDTFELAE